MNNKEIFERARKIKFLLLDVDGVMSSGKIIYTDEGIEIKEFCVKDGHGIKLLLRNGIKVGFITGRRSKALAKRAQDLGVDIIYQDAKRKMEVYLDLVSKEVLKDEEICYIGDDLPDIPILKRVGLAVTVPGGVSQVKEIVHYITRNEAGKGAVREVCELILKGRGVWEDILKSYLDI